MRNIKKKKRPSPLQISIFMFISLFSMGLGFSLVYFPTKIIKARRLKANKVKNAKSTKKESGPSETKVKETYTPSIPEGIEIKGPFYWRCWRDPDSVPIEKKRCGRLLEFEEKIINRRSIFFNCWNKFSQSQGLLSLAIKIDFSRDLIKFWSGNSTTIEDVERLLICIRKSLKDMSLKGIPHKYNQYTIFYSIIFPESS